MKDIVKYILSAFTLVHIIDKNIWKENIETNKYLATVCCVVAILVGVFVGSGNFLHSMFNWDTNVLLSHALSIIAILLTVCITESIMCANKGLVALYRSLLIIGILILSTALGFIASVVALTIIVIALAILAIGLIFGALLSGGAGGSGKTITLDNGTKVTKGMDGLYRNKSGDKYSSSDGGNTFVKEN